MISAPAAPKLEATALLPMYQLMSDFPMVNKTVNSSQANSGLYASGAGRVHPVIVGWSTRNRPLLPRPISASVASPNFFYWRGLPRQNAKHDGEHEGSEDEHAFLVTMGPCSRSRCMHTSLFGPPVMATQTRSHRARGASAQAKPAPTQKARSLELRRATDPQHVHERTALGQSQ
jgi:hypothetical protein